MLYFLILLTVELLVFLVLRELFYSTSRVKFLFAVIINFMFSLWFWYLLFRILTYKGPYDNPWNINCRMNVAGLLSGVYIPRFLLIAFHYTGKLLKIRDKGYIRWMTFTGLFSGLAIFLIVGLGSYKGRFNFRTEEVTIRTRDLPQQLNGLRIVQLSDLHLASFYRHHARLQNLMERINSYKPDLIFNTGDFISYGWREFDDIDTILVKAKSRYGNFAVFGNHDMGTYFPNTNISEMENNTIRMREKISASGYQLLFDANRDIVISGVKIELIGVRTSGRFPGMIHGSLDKALANQDSAAFRILLAHDPNQWDEDVKGKTDINLTLSGHTHGMQMGICTKKFRWSPAAHYYPHWGGLYSEGNQFLYVNRGLGVLAIPFRIWMPPEITVITLESS